MCGRYTITSTARQLVERFRAELLEAAMETASVPRYNVAPTQTVPIVLNEGGRRIEALRWGLIPSWAKDESIGNRLINARIETVAQKPSFRSALKHRRCLVPADGYYEWQKTPAGKVPLHITLESGELFAMAGLWDQWTAPDGKTTRSFTILTAPPLEGLKHIHDRMPVIVDSTFEDCWLDDASSSEDLLRDISQHRSDRWLARPVSKRVNSPRNDDASLIGSLEP